MGFVNQIKVTAKLLNCRFQPSMSAKIMGTIKMDEVHNVVAEQNGWGQLENGTWINLSFTVPYDNSPKTEEIPTVFVTGMSVVEEKAEEVAPEISVTEIASTVEVAADVQPAVSKQTKPKYRLHKVKKGGISGESLWDIAEQQLGRGERYTDIKEFNNLKSDILRAGMVLKIPVD